MDQTSGAPGSSIPVSGNGFAATADIAIKYDGTSVASVKTDASGVFSTTFKVPSGPAGQHKILVSDGVIPTALTFTSTATAQISAEGTSGTQIAGNIGSIVKITGSGYNPGAALSVNYDSAQIATTAVSTDGSFSVSFKVPAGKSGKHSISASDGTNSISGTFLMDSTPPPAASPMSPVSNSRAPEPLPKFQWSSVNDPSGVTYNLQISADSSFSSILLQKTGLTANSYQIGQGRGIKIHCGGQALSLACNGDRRSFERGSLPLRPLFP